MAKTQQRTGPCLIRNGIVLTVTLLTARMTFPGHVKAAPTTAPAGYRAAFGAVEPISDETVIVEAEEFRVDTSGVAGREQGWKARKWGENYYAATFANTFLSRKAFLGAPEQANDSTARIVVRVPKPGRYLALVRYEAAHQFQTQFHLRIEQAGKVRLDRLYGARDNLKIWAFREKVKPQVVWSWGAGEDVVWEGHSAAVDLEAGPATLTLLAGRQPEPAACRNVDLVMLTSDIEQVRRRIDTENYLPVDGMLTQAGDLYVKLHNDPTGAAVVVTIPPGIEHSPYWVHQRTWKPLKLEAEPGKSTDWVEVGSLLDTMNDGQWRLSAAGKAALRFSLEFGVPTPAGPIRSIRRFDNLSGDVELAYHGDTRYSQQIQSSDEVLYDLLAELKAMPATGVAPRRTPVYGYTFERRERDPGFNSAIDQFVHLIGANALRDGSDGDIPGDAGPIRGYIDVRDQTPEQVKAVTEKLAREGRADKIAVVSLGDEIGLPQPPEHHDAEFRQWLRDRKLNPGELDPASKGDWEKLVYSPDPAAAKDHPGLYYYSRVYANRFGIARLKQVSDVLRAALPNAGIGANFSPHQGHPYLGEVAKWVSAFREGALTMPWSEDYAWQPPIGSQQMNSLSLDLFRCGVRDHPEARIQFYVMAHSPGNTPNSWRRQFYADLGHGMKIVNLYEFRPVQAAYTENHVTGAEMYQAVRQGLRELGGFEDFIQDGRVRPAETGLYFSEAGDIWDNNRDPFGAAKRTLYIAIRHQQLPLDVVVEADALDGALDRYKLLYLCDQNVSRAASAAIARWVSAGGRLFATAGAGMFDEFNQPNANLREFLGVRLIAMDEPKDPVRFEKQDLPFASIVDTVRWKGSAGEVAIPVIGVRCHFETRDADENRPVISGTFSDGSPAVTVRRVGAGSATSCGFLPGLSYFKPAIPLRPVDRGSRDDSMSHFIPTAFDAGADALIGSPAAGLDRPTICSERLVETTIVQSDHGLLVPLINWSGHSLPAVSLTIPDAARFKDAHLAGGGTVLRQGSGAATFRFDLDVADALILR